MEHDVPVHVRVDELERELSAAREDLHRTAEELERSHEVLLAQARFEESERRFRATFENAAVGITLVDLEDRFVDANERYCEITGWSEEELRHKTWRDITHPDDLGTDAALARSLLAGEIPGYDLEKRYVRKDGSIAWVHLSCAIVRDDRGAPQYWVAVVQDISERKRLQRALAESRAEQHALDELRRVALDAAQMGSWELDLRTLIVQGDERARELFGLDELAAPLAVPLSRIHADDRPRVDAAIEAAMSATAVFTYDVEFRTLPAPGIVRWVRAVGHVVFDAPPDERKPGRFIGILMDETARKKVEEALADANRRKDEYLAILSHELRNPLAAIRTAAEVVARASEPDTSLASASAVLERQSSHMAELLDGLLDVSRITRGKLTMRKVPVELRGILRDVVADHATEARRGGVALRAEIGDAPMQVLGDGARLTQIFSNLVGNAVGFTPPGGEVGVRATIEDRHAVVRVTDTGIGFPPELAEQLFEPFRQGPQDLSRPRGGLGLGLALASGLVELHGGSIEARSAGPGRGACFVVRLPLSAVRVEARAPAARSSDAPGRHVLIIEDNEDTAEMLAHALELRGHHVDVASSGSDGVRLARDRAPDVVLCDIGLPDMDGFAVARALRENETTRDVTLVALTGYGRPEDRARCREAGFDVHLTKPVDLRTIERAIATDRTRED